MASRRDILSVQRRPRASKQCDQGKRPRGIKKEELREVRRSARISRLQKGEDKKAEQASPSPPAGKVPEGRIALLRPQILHNPSKLHQKRERGQEAGHSFATDGEQPPSERPRTSPPLSTAKENAPKEPESDIRKNKAGPVETWIQTNKWPSEYFKQDSQAREDFFQDDSLLEQQMEWSSIPVVQYVVINGFRYPRPTPKVQAVRPKPSEPGLTGSSNQKKVPYSDNRYPVLLAAKGSHMKESDLGISVTSRTWCTKLLNSPQTVPDNSPFRDDKFEKTCGKIQDRNESRVIQDIARLIVPSAENLATDGAKHLDHLIENVNEAWAECILVEGPRPQPDYSVGFQRSAFTDEQLKKFDPFIGSVFDTSFFVATYRMYFPFLTSEVKCGAAALDFADRQNAHSMTLAVRGVVELFRLVKREKELHREILAFSLSHDHRTVRIYGHYPIMNGNTTTFYRRTIHEFNFTVLDGRDKWTAYKFTKNVYEVWMPTHLKRICSVIDQLPPNVNFEVARGSELRFPEASGLSQKLDGLLSEPSNVDSASGTSQDDSELVPIDPEMDTTDTSNILQSQGIDQALLKRPKRKHAVE
ncbi:hypothetical protein MMC18_008114 [Xylographa bjoerkii]|nr:hypothetical protein [Xylographa bjoerkii]